MPGISKALAKMIKGTVARKKCILNDGQKLRMSYYKLSNLTLLAVILVKMAKITSFDSICANCWALISNSTCFLWALSSNSTYYWWALKAPLEPTKNKCY